MEPMIKIDGAVPENRNIPALAKAIVEIICAGGDREVTLRALAAFEGATHVSNTISYCNFTNRIEKE